MTRERTARPGSRHHHQGPAAARPHARTGHFDDPGDLACPPTASPDPLAELSAAGVSVWLDDLSRELLAGGELEELIARKHVVGVTTNPTIFASALAKGDRYDDQLRRLRERGTDAEAAVAALTTDDVRTGCRVLAPVHRRTAGVDGRVSIEVDPRLARDADATIAQARTLWETVGEPNLFVKIPATEEGLRAITEVIAGGLSVNVTLIFSLDRYRAVLDAYMSGLERAGQAGHDLTSIHSVASFFVSRVDTEVDRRLEAIGTPRALELKGGAALANARLAHQVYETTTAEPRWRSLAVAGARPQRPLWASTGVKDPSYPDTLYVSGLAIPGTVSTMPAGTLAAFADHGTLPAPDRDREREAARAHFVALADVGVDFADVTDALERDGLGTFEKSWAELGATVSGRLNARTEPRSSSGSDTHADSGETEQASESAELLGIYLNDHLAGASGGTELLRRTADAHQDRKHAAALKDLAEQVDEDRRALRRMMSDLGVAFDPVKAGLGWLAEKAGRLKLNGHLFSRSPLSDVLELEAVHTGVQAKAACWRTLRVLADTDDRLDAHRLDALLRRADEQSTTLEELRIRAAARTLGTHGTN
ncbi:transaldolase [Streptomyces sp. NPDC001941]|uniref:transaldolase n=1 Tax=Streptomyces sp. NPDC001941 TaxID=3154659 RepID=UPI0033329805